MIPNIPAITKAILDSNTTPTAKEIASEIVDAWIQTHSLYDSQFRTVAVETPWAYRIQPKTWIVGVMDRHAEDALGLLGSEWKTGKEPKKNRDGEDSAWWNEEVWIEQMRTGPQLAIYGMALRKGTFYRQFGSKTVERWQPDVKDPRIFIRLAVKSQPPRFWPTRSDDGIFQFPDAYLDRVESALIAEAEGLRAMKLSGRIPWALPGVHCENKFHKLCPYHEGVCALGVEIASTQGRVFDAEDPGYAAIAHSGLDPFDPETIVLSASSYGTAMQCPERYRLLIDGSEEKERDESLDTGTGVHAGLAEFYRQQMVWQKQSPKVANVIKPQTVQSKSQVLRVALQKKVTKVAKPVKL